MSDQHLDGTGRGQHLLQWVSPGTSTADRGQGKAGIL